MTVDVVLAAESSGPSLLVMVIPALIIVAALIGAFVWGSRRRARRRPPAGPGPAAPRSDSWSTPEGDGPDRPEPTVPPRGPDGH
ncbi:DUF6479 family protein [Kitasatospora phosalacinea]|uniref:Uncharacterized protein n=1 Tax=Kitasatospora phosalacinea TaxID=2065 RepID=A0A9W6PIK3_9ACTN|nr:DUF6479 family protein [Kitasatospora phosalacinea]GLW55501.1 hypothetical protein Kpho01_35120 [Kitasatospora phosalacinea]